MTTTDTDSTRKHLVEQALRSALEEQNLYLVYQGQNELHTGQLVGLEALCRLHSDQLGQISPDEFIAVAESTGLIEALEQFVLKQVALDLPPLLNRFPGVRISINFSARHTAQNTFFPYIKNWLRAIPTEAIQQLDFEITETYFQHVTPQLINGLNELRQSGIRIVMDDFGSGQSSLSRLHTLPFDVIKLDKQFAQNIAHPMVHAIVKAAVEFTRQFNIGLIVEGAETPSQYQTLKDIGCQIVQGFYFGKPERLAQWLKA